MKTSHRMVRSSAGAIEWSVVSKHWGLSRIALPKLELLAGQHRQTALHKYIDETGGVVDNDFNWVVNVYNLTTIPRNLLIDLSGNAGSTQMPQTSAETFRDMAAVVPYLAANDKIVIQPRLGRQPTADEYLRASANGDKAKIERAFRENLSICAAPKVHKSLDKYRVVLTTPMRAELERFCNSGVGMEIFTLGMAYEMASSCCYQFWSSFFKKINDFMQDITPRTRYFDMGLWKALCAVQPRTTEGIDNLFWEDSATTSPDSPFQDTARSSRILVQLTDAEYLRAYRAAKKGASRNARLLSKADWGRFISHMVPALTSVITQVTRWLIPSPVRQGHNRGSMPYELEDVLTDGYFGPKGFGSDAATGLIALVSETIWEDWESFSVKLNPAQDQYPTIAIQNPTTSKITEGTTEEYMTRFRSSMAWNELAKAVARYTRYNLVEKFMVPFNDPEYSAFIMEDTKVASDVVRGAFSLRNHPEIANNPILNNNKALFRQIEDDLRKSVVLRVNEELHRKVLEEQESEVMSDADRDRVCKDQIKFEALARGYLEKREHGVDKTEGVPTTPSPARVRVPTFVTSAGRDRAARHPPARQDVTMEDADE